MNTDSLIAEIDSEISRLTQARALLAGIGTANGKAATRSKQRRRLSAEARKRIADAQKKRWAAFKAKKKAAK